jgi:hypothetical protein
VIIFGNEHKKCARFVELEDCGHIIEVTGLDQWMKSNHNKSTLIQLKKCPKCSVEIRQTPRYGNIIKETLNHIEEVKSEIELALDIDIEHAKNTLHKDADIVCRFDEVTRKLLHSQIEKIKSYYQLKFMETLNEFLNTLMIIRRNFKLRCRVVDLAKESNFIQGLEVEVNQVIAYLLKSSDCFSGQELNDITQEIERLQIYQNLCIIEKRVKLNESELSYEVFQMFEKEKKTIVTKKVITVGPGQNFTGQNFTGHNFTGQNFTGHNFTIF